MKQYAAIAHRQSIGQWLVLEPEGRVVQFPLAARHIPTDGERLRNWHWVMRSA